MPTLRLMLAVVAALLALPAAASAACPKTVEFDKTGDRAVREAEYLEVFPWTGKRIRKIGEAISGDEIDTEQDYYVPEGTRISFKLTGIRYRVRSRSLFRINCILGAQHVHMFEGTAEAEGRQPNGDKAVAGITSIEGAFFPYPGEFDFSVTRTFTGKRSTTRSTLKVADGAAPVFARLSRVPGAKRQPCQAGRSLTFHLDGEITRG